MGYSGNNITYHKKIKYFGKSSVENAVGILENGFFHDMEEHPYFSLEHFNEELWTKLDNLNHEPFTNKKHNRCDTVTVAETYQGLLNPYSRMTERLEDFIYTLTLKTSCEGASPFADRLE